MATRLKRVDPFDYRDRIVEFFWGMRAWPYSSIADYQRNWDWRYRSLSEGVPAVWVALDDSRVVGHMAVNFRCLTADGRRVRAGVPGNFLLAEAYRNSMIGASLAGAPRTLVRRGELDLLLGYGNATAHALFLGFGCKDLGAMETWVDVRQWAPVLGRRSRTLALAAPLVSAATRVRKALAGGGFPKPVGLTARQLSDDDIRRVDRSHWRRAGGLAWDGTSEYFFKRFCTSPFRATRVFGIIEPEGRVQGLVVVEGGNRLNVMECDVNEGTLNAVQAVDLAVAAIPEADLVVVPLLPGSSLAAEFGRAGYHCRAASDSDRVIGSTYWSALWDPASPLAPAIAQVDQWRLWYGWSHH